MNNKKILMLVRTSGLEYDDRVRKECISLIKLGYSIDIIVNFTSNRKSSGTTSYGVRYKALKLYSRKILPSAKGLLLKTIEIWSRVFFSRLFHKYKYVWVHEEYMALNLLIKPVSGIYIWDQHELPMFLSSSPMRRRVYKIIEKRCQAVIVANKERLNYMVENSVVTDKSKYFILNNYPDYVFSHIQLNQLPPEIDSWLNGTDYILMQGGGHASRYPLKVLQAIKEHGNYKAILVGPVASEIDSILDNDFKDILYKAGYIHQLNLPVYIDNAIVSIVLYNSRSPNSYFCEPNRLYQAINRGIPLIVGNNPPMKNIVTTKKIGVVLEDDGKDKKGIVRALNEITINYEVFKTNIVKHRDEYLWESQEAVFLTILGINEDKDNVNE